MAAATESSRFQSGGDPLPQVKSLRKALTDLAVTRVARAPESFLVPLGDRVQETVLLATVDAGELWQLEPFRKRLASLLKRSWSPSDELLQQIARTTFTEEVFGGSPDYGDRLFRLNVWHHSREWRFDSLSAIDAERAHALEAFSVLTRLRLREAHGHPALGLHLAERAPQICGLAVPMVAKVPVRALRFFLDAHATFAFNAVRAAKHPHGDQIIAYLYELLFLQQKTAIALHEYMRLAAYAGENKRDAGMINAEVSVIMEADLAFSYLKATVEKTIALVGSVFGVTDLDAKKTHKSKINTLEAALPPMIAGTFYARFLFDRIASENIDDVNSYRSGLLHKKGIADLQPHNYVHVGVNETPLLKIFGVLHEQHASNTAALVAALAILTDDLVQRDPPPTEFQEILLRMSVNDRGLWEGFDASGLTA